MRFCSRVTPMLIYRVLVSIDHVGCLQDLREAWERLILTYGEQGAARQGEQMPATAQALTDPQVDIIRQSLRDRVGGYAFFSQLCNLLLVSFSIVWMTTDVLGQGESVCCSQPLLHAAGGCGRMVHRQPQRSLSDSWPALIPATSRKSLQTCRQ